MSEQYHLHLDCGATIVGHDTSLIKMRDGSYKKMKCVELKEETRMGKVRYITIYPEPLELLKDAADRRGDYYRLCYYVAFICVFIMVIMQLLFMLRTTYGL